MKTIDRSISSVFTQQNTQKQKYCKVVIDGLLCIEEEIMNKLNNEKITEQKEEEINTKTTIRSTLRNSQGIGSII